ncbi:MAG: hypothetical protein HY744_03030 [Deltaproteobacteria bacterium]|nr:hypothetical protein [Deltaproteobacteria bacterium]
MADRIAARCAIAALGLVLGGCTDETDALGPGKPAKEEPLPGAALSLVAPQKTLTATAEQAVALAPTWLAPDLRANLVVLEPELQDSLAALLTGLEEPRARDEVAFCLAHISPTHLASAQFRPQLIVDNVASLLKIDGAIAYADIVDHADATNEGNYYSTIRYRTSPDGESVVERELDRDIYYWYVVFPTIEDERPAYINPKNGKAADPPVGRFWRDYLFWDADEGYQPLAAYLAGQDLLWKGRAYNKDDNGAIGDIIQWVQDVMVFGSDQERPVQPVRIYAKHLGRCGEHGDLTSAAARAALIPSLNVSAWANDHVWNEFWDGRWIQWEPVNTYVEHYYYYADKDKNYYRNGLGVDNDCDGEVDENSELAQPEADTDQDDVSRGAGDCDDTDASVHPGAAEVPNGKDDDCDGEADEGAGKADADGDGYGIAAGDCNDWDAAIHPGAPEKIDGKDNDCNGVADQGTADADADQDGKSIAQGDCNDHDAAIHPGAAEIADGKDNDCDGAADEGASEADGDGDGYSIAEGDCNDRSKDTHPEADEVWPSNNRNFAVSAWRGDGKVWTVTERYAGTFTLDVHVTDANGAPVDGAMVLIAGYSTVYPDNPGVAPATWAATDGQGRARFELGEANKYYGRVESALGSFPSAKDKVTSLFDDPVKGEKRSWEVKLGGAVGGRQVDVVPAAGESPWLLDIDYDFEPGFTTGTNFFTKAQFRERTRGGADIYIVDEAGLAKLRAGEPTDATSALPDAGAGSFVLGVPAAGAPWYVVAAARPSLAGVVGGWLRVDALWGGHSVATQQIAAPLVAGDLLAIKFEPLAPAAP